MSKGEKKVRLDLLLVERGLAKSRERAQALILARKVLVNDEPITKAGTAFSSDVLIRLREPDHPYVSRGALKLEHALREFKIDTHQKNGLDVGASTGGFTEILLLHGASKVTALDVGHGQLDWKIRSDPRVQTIEGMNARNLKFEDLGQVFEVIVSDVSFISLTKILQPLLIFSDPQTDWVTLIKPQFELGPEHIEKGGIVRDPQAHQVAIDSVTRFAESIGLIRLGLLDSPITGTDGNKEFLAHWRKSK